MSGIVTARRTYTVVASEVPKSAAFTDDHAESSKFTVFQSSATSSSCLYSFHVSYSIWKGMAEENMVEIEATPEGI